MPVTETEREVAALYCEHAPGLLRYALTLANDEASAQDALQEVFLRYFVLCSQGKQVAHPKAWLFRVLRNHLLDALKSYRVKNEVAIEGIQESPDSRHDPEQRYQRAEAARDLNRLLSPRERECVRLRAEGFSYDDIAHIMGLRTGTVGATLARAHTKFRRARGLVAEEKQRAVPRGIVAPEEGSYSS